MGTIRFKEDSVSQYSTKYIVKVLKEGLNDKEVIFNICFFQSKLFRFCVVK